MCNKEKQKLLIVFQKTQHSGQKICQKLLPCEILRQNVYFRKKRSGFTCQYFFTKESCVLQKHIYFTCIYCCDQGAKDVLGIGRKCLKKFQQGVLPDIDSIYTQSDHAVCYHRPYSRELFYCMCKYEGLRHFKYDFNEPCKRKIKVTGKVFLLKLSFVVMLG